MSAFRVSLSAVLDAGVGVVDVIVTQGKKRSFRKITKSFLVVITFTSVAFDSPAFHHKSYEILILQVNVSENYGLFSSVSSICSSILISAPVFESGYSLF